MNNPVKMKANQTILLISLFLVIQQSCQATQKSQLGQPLIQLSHDNTDDDYPEVKDEIHLEDFFWTGSGDGPPDFLKKVHTGITKGKETVFKTETVVATIYVDGNNEIDIPICLDCKPDDGGGTWDMGGPGMPPLNYSSTDRRYWLLTVMSGFYTAKDNPTLEEKLARLYRLAFTRQQTRHLGITGAQQIGGVNVPAAPRERRKSLTPPTRPETTTGSPADDVEILDMQEDEEHYIKTVRRLGEDTEWASNSEEEQQQSEEPPPMGVTPSTSTESIDYGAYVTLIPWELIQQNGKSEKLREMHEALLTKQPPVQQQQQQAMEGGMEPPRSQPQTQPLYRDEHVRVVIHNLTQISEADVQKWSTNTNGFGTMEEHSYVNLKFSNDRPIANQTELIYTVLVNGRPVLATTAAKDMELVSESEAVKAFGQAVYMKSEPYIREPTATALAPVPRSGQAGFFNSVKNNVALVVISSLAILLLMLLLVAVLLLGRTRSRQRELSAVNRNSSRNELLSEGQSMRPTTSERTEGEPSPGHSHSRDTGVRNFSYEREPRISFPAPPQENQSRSRRDSITSSTDNTSDSSVYCPINPPSADVQRILDDKAARLFDAHKRRHQYDRAEGHEETVYTSVVSEKKGDKMRHKSRRRYLNENRVGSLETSPVQGSLAGHSSAEDSPEVMRRSYENFQRNEAFNPHNNYHRNKLLTQKTGRGVSAEAINNEMIRNLQPSDKSDTASVGSFLSMASVRAFPKSTHPEPLNRVLDPVFVTYYDNVNAVAPHNSTRSLRSHKSQGSKDNTIATIASFPSPKAPPSSVRNVRSASHSDNPDPGVVGPVVWERHKKKQTQEALNYADYNPSPLHNPSAIRNHYEGLLEGALQMYSSQDDIPMPLPTQNFTNNRRVTKREHRGSSAGLPSFHPSGGSKAIAERPATAQPEKTSKSAHSTQPPSPTYSAWGGGSMYSSHSTLNRPVSAGPTQRMENRLDPSNPAGSSSGTAPLIEAIQSELRKFKQQQE
ncbi:uncharacterized protein LOC119554776 isoform X4 [Drosophila subpulchrella]|uniref:uncharacterized protein LOC119554776 isoform X4 n=1 Tax=Drosophila subpulchrella TaxID=1486046 RepID=UPI0018A13CE2|nr:uncharacterized protein LOC119554776 isoform X4 [Drosophila subpulchrella]